MELARNRRNHYHKFVTKPPFLGPCSDHVADTLSNDVTDAPDGLWRPIRSRTALLKNRIQGAVSGQQHLGKSRRPRTTGAIERRLSCHPPLLPIYPFTGLLIQVEERGDFSSKWAQWV